MSTGDFFVFACIFLFFVAQHSLPMQYYFFYPEFEFKETQSEKKDVRNRRDYLIDEIYIIFSSFFWKIHIIIYQAAMTKKTRKIGNCVVEDVTNGMSRDKSHTVYVNELNNIQYEIGRTHIHKRHEIETQKRNIIDGKSHVDMVNEQTDYDTNSYWKWCCSFFSLHFQCLYLCATVIMLSKWEEKHVSRRLRRNTHVWAYRAQFMWIRMVWRTTIMKSLHQLFIDDSTLKTYQKKDFHHHSFAYFSSFRITKLTW